VRFDEEDATALPPASAELLAEAVRSALPGLAVLVVSDYAKGVVSKGLAGAVLAECRAAGVPVIVDPKPVNAESFAGATIVKPNLGEALRLVHMEAAPDDASMRQLCQRVAQRTGVPAVVVTAGARGMYVLDGSEFAHLEGVAREVYDVAGAGDSVLAAMALGLAAGLGVTDASRLGNMAGSIAVGHLGIAAVTQSELAVILERQGQANVAA
jgi:D-beta-D-heptose 7-phosphate kinase/D-beta-D-heptose 1-phosphate adenosyltransferase